LPQRRLLVFGNGYTGRAIATGAAALGWDVTITSRTPSDPAAGVRLVAFDAAPAADATHVVSTVPPDRSAHAQADPVLASYGGVLAANGALRWAGYLSTSGVYGDRGGGWVDEDTPPAPTGPRGTVRLACELAWSDLATRTSIDLFRVAGIYGPGRSPLNAVRAGTARRIVKPGHAFGRIHRDDIVQAVLAAAAQDRPPGIRALNLTDDEPAENATVAEEAARLLGVPPPPSVRFEHALQGMTEMGRSFWAENRKVASRKTQAALGIAWRYPSYREGLRAILVQECEQRPP
jgi:nucleoside-diphosphate-sugar epimerase